MATTPGEPDDAAIVLPRRVGPYAVRRALGEGGMGRVLLAEDAAGRRVALKVLAPWAAPEDALRFEREVHVLRGLRHPNIVQLVDDGVDPRSGEPYLALELVDGLDLDALLASREGGRATLDEAAYVLARVARALAALHAIDVVHRDVKPGNVLVALDGAVKLTDFGLALVRERQRRVTGPHELLGSSHYLAPEAISSDVISPAADLYALGALAHRLLAGEPLFAGRDVKEVLAAHLREPAPPLRQRRPDAPEPLAALVDRLVAKAPEERPAAADVAAALEPLGPAALALDPGAQDAAA